MTWGKGNLEFKVYGSYDETFEGTHKDYFDDYPAALGYARQFSYFELIRRPENIRMAYSKTEQNSLRPAE